MRKVMSKIGTKMDYLRTALKNSASPEYVPGKGTKAAVCAVAATTVLSQGSISNAAVSGTAQSSNANTLIETIMNTFASLLPWIGVAFLILGVMQLAIAFRNGDNNPDAIANGVKSLIVGSILVVFKLVFYDGVIKPAMQ